MEFIPYLSFLGGFALLIYSAKWLVEGSSSIARKLKISDLIIGLTVVSFGTSAPELIINMLSSFNNEADLAIGNIIGSNISNILLILGITALIIDLPVQKNTILSEIPFSLTAALLFGFLANASIVNESEGMMISRIDGAVLLLFFLLFIVYILFMARQNKDIVDTDEIGELPMGKAIFFSILGMIGLFFGGKFVVDGAVEIALSWGFSKSFIGLTIVAVGTSLPELVTSAMAALRNNADIAVGNVVGSNIFNILWILGITALINPLPFNVVSNSDILVIIFASALIIVSMIVGKKYTIERWQGLAYVAIYITYLTYLVSRG